MAGPSPCACHLAPYRISCRLIHIDIQKPGAWVGPMCWSRRSAGLSCRDPRMHESQVECLGRAACRRKDLLRAKAAEAAAAATTWRWKSKSRARMGVEQRSHDGADLRKIARRYCSGEAASCGRLQRFENLCSNPLPLLLWAHPGLSEDFVRFCRLLLGHCTLLRFLACSRAQGLGACRSSVLACGCLCVGFVAGTFRINEWVRDEVLGGSDGAVLY